MIKYPPSKQFILDKWSYLKIINCNTVNDPIMIYNRILFIRSLN